MTDKKIFIIENGEQSGPYTAAELRVKGLDANTPVWTAGMADWKPLGEVPELSKLICDDSAFGAYAMPEEKAPQQPAYVEPAPGYPDPEYYAMIAGIRIGPAPVSVLMARGLNPATPVWREGMADWAPASTRNDIMQILGNVNAGGFAPGYQQPQGIPQPQVYQQPQGYQQPYPQDPYQQPQGAPVHRTNWMPAAIVALVLGLCSVVPMILAIIGIVKSNEANKAYEVGDTLAGDRSNSSAKICTIIALVLEGIGLVVGFIVGITDAFSF